LKAIERGDYKNLPESVYAIGFIRSYAKFLGIEGDDMANELRRVLMQQSISENNYDEEVDEPSRSLSTDCSALFSRWQGCSSPRIAGVLLVIAVLAVLADLICGCFG
jgi:cytoskeletal protein RodZ